MSKIGEPSCSGSCVKVFLCGGKGNRVLNSLQGFYMRRLTAFSNLEVFGNTDKMCFSEAVWAKEQLERIQEKWENRHFRQSIVYMGWLDGITNSTGMSQENQGDNDEQRSLACCSSWGQKELDTNQSLNNNKNTVYTWLRQ